MSLAMNEKSLNIGADVVVCTVEEPQHRRTEDVFGHFPPDTGKGQR